MAIFMSIIWSYMFFFLFFGPEMSQEERQEHEDSAAYLEEMRKQGVSLKEIGIQRARCRWRVIPNWESAAVA
jgi:MFS transporter, SHS family, lactate transporter